MINLIVQRLLWLEKAKCHRNLQKVNIKRNVIGPYKNFWNKMCYVTCFYFSFLYRNVDFCIKSFYTELFWFQLFIQKYVNEMRCYVARVAIKSWIIIVSWQQFTHVNKNSAIFIYVNNNYLRQQVSCATLKDQLIFTAS